MVVHHPPTAPIARLLEIDLAPMLTTGAAPIRGQTFETFAFPHRLQVGWFSIAGSQDGDDIVFASRGPGGGPVLVHRVFGQADSREVAMGGSVPAALLVRRGVVFVGVDEGVWYVDLRETEMRSNEAFRSPTGESQWFGQLAYGDDFLVAAGTLAVTFALDARGRPNHRGVGVLPRAHYTGAAAVGTGDDGRLFLMAVEPVDRGIRHVLMAPSVRGFGLGSMPQSLGALNADSLPVVMESDDRHGNISLLGGSAYTEWHAMTVLGSDAPGLRLALAAGLRGVMLLPAPFTEGSVPTLIEVGGYCRDIVARGDVLVALVGDPPPATPFDVRPDDPPPGPSRLVLVHWDGSSARAVADYPLDAAYTSLLH